MSLDWVTAPAAGDGSPAAAGYASGIGAGASSLPRQQSGDDRRTQLCFRRGELL